MNPMRDDYALDPWCPVCNWRAPKDNEPCEMHAEESTTRPAMEMVLRVERIKGGA